MFIFITLTFCWRGQPSLIYFMHIFFLCSFIWPCLRLTRVEQMTGNSQELEIAQSNGTHQDFLKSVMLVVQAMTSLQNSKTAIRIWTLKETAIRLITVNYINLLELWRNQMDKNQAVPISYQVHKKTWTTLRMTKATVLQCCQSSHIQGRRLLRCQITHHQASFEVDTLLLIKTKMIDYYITHFL